MTSKNYSDKILGAWENADIEYYFYEDNSMDIHWKKNDSRNKGIYSIQSQTIMQHGVDVEIDIIVFKYGYINFTSNWKGKIVDITENQLIIEDLSNQLGQIDIMYKEYNTSLDSAKNNKNELQDENINYVQNIVNNIKLNSNKIGLSKYIISRILLVFFALLSYEWLSNIDKQVINFFNAYEGSFLYYLLVIMLGAVVITICGMSLIGVFYMLHAVYNLGLEKVLKKLTLKNIIKLITKSPFLITPIFNNEIKIENEYKKYTIPFVAIGLILILFIGGSPLVNNYRAVYLNYEVYSDSDGNTTYKEKQTYVFDKDDTNLINSKINSLDNTNYIEEWAEDVDDSGLDYYGTSRGYLFEQTALIEGFESYKKNTSGFFSYISCLIYFIIEKFIVTLIYFLIPFITWIGISMYKNKS